VPLDTPLRLVVGATDRSCRLEEAAGGPLVTGAVAAAAGAAPGDAPLPDLPHAVPVSRSCFACGVDNPLGLRAALRHDGSSVGGAWEPRATLAGSDGRLAPIALTTLLDEAAFWLGALASGESGMTTDLEVTLDADAPFAGPIAVAGRGDRVRPRADDPRYWETEVAAWGASGRPLAHARITFVAVRGAARRLVTGLFGMNAPDVVRRAFPAYAR
jgi:hypothetical protein